MPHPLVSPRSRAASSVRASRPAAWAALGLLGVLGLTGCSASGANDSGRASGASVTSGAAGASSNTGDRSSAAASPNASQGPPVTIAGDVAQGAPLGLSQPITVTSEGAKPTAVEVKGADGQAVPGTFDASTGTWLPSGILKKGATYVVTATVTTPSGQKSTSSRTVTAAANGATTTGIYTVTPYSRGSVGNAQPVVLTFSQAVPQEQRAEVAKRFTVTDTAGMEGAWRWVSPTRLDYRPKTFWPVGDEVKVTGSIQGMKIGPTWGAGTLTDTGFTVTSDLAATYDAKTRLVTVTEGGKVIRTMKSGGGKKGFETPTGALVVLGKQQSVRMTSCSTGISCTPGEANYYDETIAHAVQITPSGLYLHAAPWDKQLGQADTSHGCLHLSAEDAAWFYSKAVPGTLVTIKGSEPPVEATNGQTEWMLTWEQWIS